MAGWCKGSTLGSEPKDFGSIPDSATMRKGVLVMKKRLTSFFLVLALSFSLSLPAFAVDDNNYYSLPPVGGSEPSTAFNYPVTPSATGDGWTSSDSNRLRDIWQALTDSSSGNYGSIAYCVWWIWNYMKDDIRPSLGNIDRNTSVTASRILDSNSLLGSINTSISGGNSVLESINSAVSGINGYATENTLSSYSDYFKTFFGRTGSLNDMKNGTGSHIFGLNTGHGHIYYAMQDVVQSLLTSLLYDREFNMTSFDENGNQVQTRTASLYHYVKNLSETLASEDDKQLAENYKENREQAEQDFLNGKSGKTSLGKGDFSNASQVGGALNDTFNMGGAAKVSDFLSGFGSAGIESQVWFSQTTANNLNAVEAGDGTAGVSTFADDGETMVDVDSDPYNMGNIFERYDWLEGVNMDD